MTNYKAVLFVLSLLLFSCKGENKLEVSEIKTERISIDDKLQDDEEISEFIAPFKDHLNATLDSTLAFNPISLSKNDGDLNTALGNLMADIVMAQADPVFNKRTGNKIDMVLLNHGGIRAEIPKGAITSRTAYQVMPFENEIVVAELTGKRINEMLKYLEKAKTAHPVSGIEIIADKNYNTIKASLNGSTIDENKTYFVATSDYLVNGGDNMSFFKDPVNLYKTDYKIRNAMIDYFKKIDTVKTEIDKRYIRE